MFTLPTLPQPEVTPPQDPHNAAAGHQHTLYQLIDHGRHAVHDPFHSQSLNSLGEALLPYVKELQAASPTTQARVIVERYLRDIDAQSCHTVRLTDLQRFLEDALYKASHVNPYTHPTPPEFK